MLREEAWASGEQLRFRLGCSCRPGSADEVGRLGRGASRQPLAPRLNPRHHAAAVLVETALFLVRAEGTLAVFLIAFLEGFF